MTKTKSGLDKKVRVYECKHFEFEYDDLGKYCWCHNPEHPGRECDVDYKICMQYCPYFSKNEDEYVLIEVSDHEKAVVAEAKKKLEAWKVAKAAAKAAAEKAEYEMYLRLKSKYENNRTEV